jgi:hypothetical protein
MKPMKRYVVAALTAVLLAAAGPMYARATGEVVPGVER